MWESDGVWREKLCGSILLHLHRLVFSWTSLFLFKGKITLKRKIVKFIDFWVFDKLAIFVKFEISMSCLLLTFLTSKVCEVCKTWCYYFTIIRRSLNSHYFVEFLCRNFVGMTIKEWKKRVENNRKKQWHQKKMTFLQENDANSINFKFL